MQLQHYIDRQGYISQLYQRLMLNNEMKWDSMICFLLESGSDRFAPLMTPCDADKVLHGSNLSPAGWVSTRSTCDDVQCEEFLLSSSHYGGGSPDCFLISSGFLRILNVNSRRLAIQSNFPSPFLLCPLRGFLLQCLFDFALLASFWYSRMVMFNVVVFQNCERLLNWIWIELFIYVSFILYPWAHLVDSHRKLKIDMGRDPSWLIRLLINCERLLNWIWIELFISDYNSWYSHVQFTVSAPHVRSWEVEY